MISLINVTTMIQMFANCTSLTSLDASNFDTSNVTTMQYMFSKCTSLKTLNISGFNLSKLTTSTSVKNIFLNTALAELTTPAVMSSQSIALAKALKDSNGNSYSALTSTTPTKTLLKSSWT